MAQILVKAKPGRVAYSAVKGGALIPEDRFIPVNDGNWIRRLAEVHGDIEIKSVAEASPVPSVSKKSTSGA
jgi:hypothetical protein